MGPAAIHTENVAKRFGKFEALRGVSLDVPRGAIYGLLGPNGAGKSTLIKLLVGISRATSGEARILGLDPIGQRRQLRRRIGYMPQVPALYDDLSTRDNVRFFGRAHLLADLERRVDAAVEFVGLAGRQHSPVYTLSGGMRQRASMACTLVHDPEVLFLDEPTAGVDPKLKEGFWQRFRELAARGATLLISTHLMDEALLCDRLTILRDGQVLITAPPAEIMQQGETRVRIWRDGRMEETTIRQYYTELPRLLQRYDLDPSVTLIELHEDSLETIMLRLVEGEEE